MQDNTGPQWLTYPAFILLCAGIAALLLLISLVSFFLYHTQPLVTLPSTVQPSPFPTLPTSIGDPDHGTLPSGTAQDNWDILWSDPSTALTVARGASIPLLWQTSGNPEGQRVYFALSRPGIQTQTERFDAQALQGVFPVKVPPGTYTLKATYPLGQQKQITVTVSGPAVVVSSDDSYLSFDTKGEIYITDDGHCSITVVAHVLDQFGYGIGGKTVFLRSNRGRTDQIRSLSRSTYSNGEMRFTITSRTPGTMILSGRTEDADFSHSLPITVFSSKETICPEEQV